MNRITIFLNRATDAQGRHLGFFGYEPDHQLEDVFTFDGESPDDAFRIGNGAPSEDNEYEERASAAYYALRNRSVSVGDVIRITEPMTGVSRWYACAPVGWDDIEVPTGITLRSPYDTVRYES